MTGHLLARCLEPAAITESALKVCIAVASRDEWFSEERKAALSVATMTGQPKMQIAGGVATIPVSGPLVRKGGAMADLSALTTYDTLSTQLADALANPAVKAIHWIFDSPGGEVSGLFELADEIVAARGKKPMAASAIKADSAAYTLAAAVGNIAIEQAGEAGSVGVIMGYQMQDEETRAKRIEFVSSVSPLKNVDPTTDEGRASIQARCDQMGALLVEKVASYRGVTAAAVAEGYGKGDVMLGARAVEAGLVDSVDSIAGVRARLARQGSKNMNAQMFGLGADASAEAIDAAAKSTVDFRDQVLAAVGADDPAVALGSVVAAMESHKQIDALRAEVAELKTGAVKRDLRALLETNLAAGKLSLGAIQRAMPALLRGAARAEWQAAMASVDATKDAVLAAADKVNVSADDLVSISEFVKASAPVAAPAFDEPARDSKQEAADLDPVIAAIDRAADAARKTLNRADVRASK